MRIAAKDGASIVRRLFAATGCALASLIGVPATASAELLSSIAWLSSITGQGVNERINLTTNTNDLLSVTDPLNRGLGSATALTDYGIHKLFADTESIASGGVLLQSTASLRSRWNDSIVIGGGSGQDQLTVLIEIDGSLSSSGANVSNSAGASLNFSFGGPAVLWTATKDCFPCTLSQNATFSGGVLSATFLFNYGTPINLLSEFVLVTSFGGNGLFGDTVTLAFDLPTGATISSANGANYRVVGEPPATAVPAPETASLLALGILLLTGFKARRDRVAL